MHGCIGTHIHLMSDDTCFRITPKTSRDWRIVGKVLYCKLVPLKKFFERITPNIADD